MTRIVIAETADNAGRDLSVERSIIGPQADIVHYICDGDEDRLIDACRDADAVLTDYSPFSRNVIAHLKNCRVISVAATGYNRSCHLAYAGTVSSTDRVSPASANRETLAV
jgi:D-3-phosphoglycerate dehydrogenase